MSIGKRRRIVIVVLVAAVGLVVMAVVLFPRGAPPDALSAAGTVEATEARLGFQVPGRIDTIFVREGDVVRAGQELARLDRDEMLAQREHARAQVTAARALVAELERGSRPEEVSQARVARDAARRRSIDAERDLERARRLFDGGAISRETYDKAELARDLAAAELEQAEEQRKLVEAGPRVERIQAQRAQLAQARASLKAVEATLATMTVVAPFDGVVTVRHHEPGETVGAGIAVLTLLNPDDRWVRIYVREDRIGAVQLGATASISTDTYPSKRYGGEVTFIASEAEFTPKSVQTSEERVKLVYAVKVRVTADGTYDLKPGMPADVRLDLGQT